MQREYQIVSSVFSKCQLTQIQQVGKMVARLQQLKEKGRGPIWHGGDRNQSPVSSGDGGDFTNCTENLDTRGHYHHQYGS